MRIARAAAAGLVWIAFPAMAQEASAIEIFTRAGKGACAACHQLPEGVGQPSRADVGPRLEGPRMRALGKPALKALLEDPMAANARTLMPPFGKHRILEPREIERVVEFLHALP
jgi:sulfur-oxidizing protein SoxX